MKKAYFIDVQGTLINDIDKKPINGALEFIKELNQKKIPYILITNNTKKKSVEFFEFLKNLGFDISFSSYLDPFMVLKEVANFKIIEAFGDKNFINNLKEMGYKIGYKNPEGVIITLKKDYNNEDYAKMISLSLGKAKLIGMHGTSIYAKDGKTYPAVGAIMAMINYATNKEFEIVGKPSENFYLTGLKILQKSDDSLKFSDIEIISDDVIGDLVGAKRLGMKTIFVLSGKYKNDKIVNSLKIDEKPNLILKDISEIREDSKKRFKRI